MAFFGFEQDNVLEKEKRRFLENGGKGEQIAEYTWGEESYDNLGDALLEGGDDLNDETFGGSGPIGKSYVYTSTDLSWNITMKARISTLLLRLCLLRACLSGKFTTMRLFGASYPILVA
jgi:hypothetical protein